jgi:hypothetical protein
MNDRKLCYMPPCSPLSMTTPSAINITSASELAAAYALILSLIALQHH